MVDNRSIDWLREKEEWLEARFFTGVNFIKVCDFYGFKEDHENVSLMEYFPELEEMMERAWDTYST
jgi:hypothetical protein